jgi:hypothetical protein
MEPSIKGTLFQNLVGELLELVDADRLGDADLAATLKPDERKLLDYDVSFSAWYPVELYNRMLQLYAVTAPGDPDAYLIAGGRRSARNLIALGLYSQLDTRTEESWENRAGRVLVTLAGSLFNFGEWQWKGLARQGFSILVDGASPMGDELVLRTAGFVQLLAERLAGTSVALTHERERGGDLLRFRAHRLD